MPYYKKYHDFCRVLPLTAPFLQRDHLEVILCIDDPCDIAQTLTLTDSYPKIRWRVLACSEQHSWRPPSKAINVGLRNSMGEYVMIVSPESAFVGDLPHQLAVLSSIYPSSAICGRLNCATFTDFVASPDLFEHMVRFQSLDMPKHFYGSIIVSKSRAADIGGYDECLSSWGGDDDNFRARLELAGVPIVRTADVNILHLGDQKVDFDNRPQKSEQELQALRQPASARCPVCYSHWGQAYDHKLRDWCG